ncbi:hypothetical protein V8B55DRAFT_1027693 [Mucor lusitanicus]
MGYYCTNPSLSHLHSACSSKHPIETPIWKVTLSKPSRTRDTRTNDILFLGAIFSEQTQEPDESLPDQQRSPTDGHLANKQFLLATKEEHASEDAEILSKLPAKHHEFKDVFSKIEADKLPPHTVHSLPLYSRIRDSFGYGSCQDECKKLANLE